MKNYFLHSMTIFAPVGWYSGLNKHSIIIYSLQLLINDYSSKNNPLLTHKELRRVFVIGGLQSCKSIIKLGNIAVMTELQNVKEVNLNIFMTCRGCRAVWINLFVIFIWQHVDYRNRTRDRNKENRKSWREAQDVFKSISILINKLKSNFMLFYLTLELSFINI